MSEPDDDYVTVATARVGHAGLVDLSRMIAQAPMEDLDKDHVWMGDEPFRPAGRDVHYRIDHDPAKPVHVDGSRDFDGWTGYRPEDLDRVVWSSAGTEAELRWIWTGDDTGMLTYRERVDAERPSRYGEFFFRLAPEHPAKAAYEMRRAAARELEHVESAAHTIAERMRRFSGMLREQMRPVPESQVQPVDMAEWEKVLLGEVDTNNSN